MDGGLDAELCDLRTVAGVRRLVLRSKRPARSMLGGGKFADIVLWKNKMASIMILLWVTSIWISVEWGGFKILPLICYSLAFASMITSFQSEVRFFIDKLYNCFKQARIGFCNGSQTETPTDADFSCDLIRHIVKASEFVMEEASKAFQCTGLEKNFYHFITVNAVLWIVSIISSWFDFVSLVYMGFLIVYGALALYGRYEDDVDSAIVKALFNIHRHYLVLNATILNTIRRCQFMKMKLH